MIKYQFINRDDGWRVRRIEQHERDTEIFQNTHWLAVARRAEDFSVHDWQLMDDHAYCFPTYEAAFHGVFQPKGVEAQGCDYGHCWEVELK